MNNQDSQVKKPRAKKVKEVSNPSAHSGPEIWDGNNSGWTLVTYKRKNKNKNKK